MNCQSSSTKKPFLAGHTLHRSLLFPHRLPSFFTTLMPHLVTLSTKTPSTYFTHHFPQLRRFPFLLLGIHPLWPGPPCCFIPFLFNSPPLDLSLQHPSIFCVVLPVGVVDSAIQIAWIWGSCGQACVPHGPAIPDKVLTFQEAKNQTPDFP